MDHWKEEKKSMLTKLMIYYIPILSRDAFRDFHQLQLHPRSNLIQPHGTPLPFLVIPSNIIVSQRHRIPLVPGYTLRRRRSRFIPPVRPMLAPPPQQEISHILLVPEIQQPTTRRGCHAFNDAANAFGDAVRLDTDHIVTEIKRAAFGVEGDEDDTTGGGERYGFW